MHRSVSPYRLIVLAGVISVVGIVGFSKFHNRHWIPGTTRTYHPPATEDRAAAASALDATGFSEAARDGAKHVFAPTFQDGESIAFGARLSHELIDSTKTTNVHAAISILAKEDAGEQKRAPLNIALVIDRSGSMVGEKMDYAKVASRTLIHALGPQDTLSIVSYSDSSRIDSHPLAVTTAGRMRLTAALDNISCMGGTNISAGLEDARNLLIGNRREGAISRIVLLSDGQANQGITGREGLGRIAANALEQSIATTAMGVGLDYDELVMHEIANRGAGNYYFIRNGSETETIFEQEIGNMQSAIAQNTKLDVTLPPNVTLVEVHGFPYSLTSEGFSVPLDALAAQERKDLLIEFTIAPGTDGPLVPAVLSYDDVATGRRVTRNADLRVQATPGEERVNPPVAKRLQQIKTIDAFKRAMEMYDRGDRYAAADLIDAQRKANNEFLDAHDLHDPAFDRVDGEFEDLAESMRRTDRHSTAGKFMVKEKYQWANSAAHSEVRF